MKGNNKSYFVSVDTAKKSILKAVMSGKIVKLNINNASGYVLASDIKSPIDSPPFSNSAMDGYAIRFEDYQNAKSLIIIGESSAGKSFNGKVKNGQAVQIFTGAEIPEGTDTVVMQEKVEVHQGNILIHDSQLKKGANIRLKGEQSKKNQIAINKNTLLTPGAIGYLASLGIAEVRVFCKPAVTIIITGNELIKPGSKLKPGHIFESNSFTLKSALLQQGVSKVNILTVKDNRKATSVLLKKTINNSDLIIFTGGISVGKYDFVETVLKDEKVETVFYKVKQKPGKPIYFGMKGSCCIFGLPGNPASVLTCFYEYVIPALRKHQNNPKLFLSEINLQLTKAISKKPGLTHFLKAFTDFKSVTPLDGQQSHMMESFTFANCFIVLAEEVTEVEAGSIVKVHYFGD